MNKPSDERDHDVLERFFDDARAMSKEAGIDECTFCASFAYRAMREMVENDHDRCVLNMISFFFRAYAEKHDKPRHSDDEDED